jgi:hypothetical protein
MKKYIIFLWSIISFAIFSGFAFAYSDRIDLWVSPIRDEFNMDRWQTLTRSIKLYNNSNDAQTIYMSSEDCEADADYGAPECTTFSGSTNEKDIEKASTWITPWINGNFTIPAKWEKTVSYTISAPINASPGGHYGAVFFNSPSGGWSDDATISMVRRIGMLFMINLSGKIFVDTNIWNIEVVQNWWWTAAIPLLAPTVNFIDNPIAYIKEKGKKFMMVFTDPEEVQKMAEEINPFWEKPTLNWEDFQVDLKIPVQNNGNTHIKPTGKIFLYDGDEQLVKIWKEAILNENGAFMGEKIVDYIPINDNKGNVLPNTQRIFSVNWQWFAYGDMDAAGKYMINFENPSSYYSRLSEEAGKFMYPWERLAVRNTKKTLDAKVEMSYKNPATGKDEPYKVEVPVNIHYAYVAKTTNWSALILIFGIIFLSWRIIQRRNRDIDFLEDEVGELEHEILALEKAKKQYDSRKKAPEVAKKSTTTKKIAPKKEEEKVETGDQEKKPITRKSTTKKEITETQTKTPPKKTPAKKPVAKKSTTTKKEE